MNNLNNFKPIPGFENYLISGNAEIYSLKFKKILKISIDRCKKYKLYVRITLSNKGKRKTFYLHRLVAITFIPNPENKPEVNHKDKNIYNNCKDNLEWTTSQENTSHALKNKVDKNCIGKRKIILQYDLNGNFIKEHLGINEAAKNNGISISSITKNLMGQLKQAGGYVWKHKEYEKINGEIWKDIIIDLINTNYKISNFGRIKNKLDILLRGNKSNGSYYISTTLTYIKDNKKIEKKEYLHRLVAIAFIPNPLNKPEVDHIDTNVNNNHVGNLRWVTGKENMNNDITKSKSNSKCVEQLDTNGNIINTFKSITEAKRYMKEKYGYKNVYISLVCNNKLQKSGGFTWKFQNK